MFGARLPPNQIEELVKYCVGRKTLKGAPFINHDTLRARGIDDGGLAKIEAALEGAFRIQFALNSWTLGDGYVAEAEEWGHVEKVPRIRLVRGPEGQLRFLTGDEISRLMAACEASAYPELATVVTPALDTGMRKGEVLGLSWDRVDFSRGGLLLEKTKSGRRHEVPMKDAVNVALSNRPGPRKGRVFLSRSIRKAFDRVIEAPKLEDF